jgi:protein-disulfide isomerase
MPTETGASCEQTMPNRHEAIDSSRVSAQEVQRAAVAVGDSPMRGADFPLVTVIGFHDFHCPYSRRGVATIDQLFNMNRGVLRIVFRNTPLSMHPDAPLAHRAALAAGDQGRFWDFHDLLFANQRDRDRNDYIRYADQLGLDVDAFTRFLDEGRGDDVFDRDLQLARDLGATGTPFFLINGRVVRGAQSVEVFQSIIDQEVAYATELLERGVPRDELYDHIVGLTGSPEPTGEPDQSIVVDRDSPIMRQLDLEFLRRVIASAIQRHLAQ